LKLSTLTVIACRRYALLQQISRVIGRPARASGGGALETKHREVAGIDQGIKETDRMLGSHGVVEPLREQDGFVAVRAVETTQNGGSYLTGCEFC